MYCEMSLSQRKRRKDRLNAPNISFIEYEVCHSLFRATFDMFMFTFYIIIKKIFR